MKKLLLYSLLMLALSVRAVDWYYIDSNSGSDTNSGTSQLSPWKNLTHAQNILGASISNTNLRLARNSYWRQQLSLGDWNDVDAYGYGARPVIDASEIVTNWIKVACLENAYAVSNFAVAGGGVTTRISAIQSGRIMILAASLSECDSIPGSFYAIHGPTPGSTNSVFIHPTFGGDPNTNEMTYEVSARDYSISAGNYNSISQVVVRNQMNNNGSIYARRQNYIGYVKAENGTKHNFYISSGMVEHCEAARQAYNGPEGASADMFVAHDTLNGQSVIFKDCKAYGDPERPAMAAAVYGHVSTSDPNPGYDYVLIDGMEASYVQSAGSIGIKSNGISIWNRGKLTGATHGGWSAYQGNHFFVNCEYIPDPRILTPTQPIVRSAGANNVVWITGCRFGAGYSSIRMDAGGSLTVLDSFLSGSISTYASSGSVIVSSNNCFTYQFPYSVSEGNTIKASGGNCFNVFTHATIGGTNYNWSQYKSSFTNLESGSLVGSLKLVGSPINGDFRYSADSPAVTNLAGSGWGPSRVPYDSRLGDLKFHIPERLATK